MAFEIKQNDRRPRYRVALTSNGAAVNLTSATGVTFLMRPEGGGATKVNAAASIVDPVTGLVEYAWAVGDTDTSGDFEVEFEVDWGGEKQTFPSSGYFPCTINDDIA